LFFTYVRTRSYVFALNHIQITDLIYNFWQKSQNCPQLTRSNEASFIINGIVNLLKLTVDLVDMMGMNIARYLITAENLIEVLWVALVAGDGSNIEWGHQ
jgi:hypothetical protein